MTAQPEPGPDVAEPVDRSWCDVLVAGEPIGLKIVAAPGRDHEQQIADCALAFGVPREQVSVVTPDDPARPIGVRHVTDPRPPAVPTHNGGGRMNAIPEGDDEIAAEADDTAAQQRKPSLI